MTLYTLLKIETNHKKRTGQFVSMLGRKDKSE